MAGTSKGESRAGVPLTNLDQPLFDGADATKRDLVDYLDGVRDRILPELEDRPLSVIRVHRGQEAFMQKNVPKYTPDWVPTVQLWAETSKRDGRVRAVQRPAHAAVVRQPARGRVPPDAHAPSSGPTASPTSCSTSTRRRRDAFATVVAVARLVRQALDDVGLRGAVKTSGAKGVHVFVPIDDALPLEDAAAATRAIAARAAAPRPRHRHHRVHEGGPRGQGVRRLDAGRRRDRRRGLQPAGAARRAGVVPGRVGRARPTSLPRDFTVHTALERLGVGRSVGRPDARAGSGCPPTLIEEGHAIPVARVQAMHEGKRRARDRRTRG